MEWIERILRKQMKYYRIILDGDDKIGGTLYAPKEVKHGIVEDSREVEKSVFNMTFTLRDGDYTHFLGSNIGAHFVSTELKQLIESCVPIDYPLEFIPIQIVSDVYGNKVYYILHFKIIFDVLDIENTIYVPGTDSIIKACLSQTKVENLHIFNSRPIINDVVISEKIRKDMKKLKKNVGIEFTQLRVV